MPSIVIVEDHLLLAETLRAGLASVGIEAVIVAPAGPCALVAELQRIDPLLVLLDLDLGLHGDSTCVIGPLAAAGIRTLVVSGATDHESIALAFEAGAFGYHWKADGFDALLTKVVAALHSGVRLDEDLRCSLGDELRRTRLVRGAALAPFERLTERERDTLIALSAGLSVHDIAGRWFISEATVRTHVRGVLGKLEAPSQLGAVALALRCGWLAAHRDLAATA